MGEIKKIELGAGSKTIEEKLEVLRKKINEIIEVIKRNGIRNNTRN